jgi:hypothetical protein
MVSHSSGVFFAFFSPIFHSFYPFNFSFPFIFPLPSFSFAFSPFHIFPLNDDGQYLTHGGGGAGGVLSNIYIVLHAAYHHIFIMYLPLLSPRPSRTHVLCLLFMIYLGFAIVSNGQKLTT